MYCQSGNLQKLDVFIFSIPSEKITLEGDTYDFIFYKR